MKSIFFKRLSIFLCFALLFCSLPVVHVKASSFTDQSKPIFGLTADDVVEKYNQLSDQQKDQVLRSIGNTSIFANSLFGNIFNSTFGVLDDAIEKIGDLFFQANGVIYKLGSSALAWISRLIDKVFNNDFNDLNISQPVVNDFYLNTKDLVYVSSPLFVNGHFADIFDDNYYSNFLEIFPLPFSNAVFCADPNNTATAYAVDFSLRNGDFTNGLFVDLNLGKIFTNRAFINFNGSDYFLSFYNYSPSDLPKSQFSGSFCNFFMPGSVSWRSSSSINSLVYGSFVNDNYFVSLQNVLNTYFVSIDYYYLVDFNNFVFQIPVDHSSTNYNITNNTYYNYIYNIPDQTPLNVTNIVSNTAIDYSPSDNIAYYLPDQYNIEQNFTVVNNYYISSGSAISSQGSIDVILVSPSVIDVRIINPEDISFEVINENNNDIINNYDFNFGDLNITNSVGTGINNAKDNLADVVTTSSINAVAGFGSSGLPSKWRYAIFGFFALGIIALVITRRGIAH